ncbi:hypothetical protein A2U01_0104508, partial [Trifolium medium]|nr:hypothetical protein [Trifolium medium]
STILYNTKSPEIGSKQYNDDHDRKNGYSLLRLVR